jgi:hypothetical protein
MSVFVLRFTIRMSGVVAALVNFRAKDSEVLNRTMGRIAANLEVLVMECQPLRAALIAATSIFFMPIIASNARFA